MSKPTAHDDGDHEVMQELVAILVARLNTERARSEDLARRLGAAQERIDFLESRHYGIGALGGFLGD